MPIKDFPEKDIRQKIISKIDPKVKKGHSKHEKGYIYLNGILVAKVKIPNSHQRIMKASKSKYIASSLRLTDEQFNGLIECPLSGKKYYQIIEDIFS